LGWVYSWEESNIQSWEGVKYSKLGRSQIFKAGKESNIQSWEGVNAGRADELTS